MIVKTLFRIAIQHSIIALVSWTSARGGRGLSLDFHTLTQQLPKFQQIFHFQLLILALFFWPSPEKFSADSLDWYIGCFEIKAPSSTA